MREFARIGTLFKDDVGEALFADLVRLVPEGLRGKANHCFWVRIRCDDPRTDEVTRLLHEAGWEPWRDTTRQPIKGEEYDFSLEREYEDSDFDAFDFLELSPSQEAYSSESIFRNRDDEIIVFEQTTTKQFDFFCAIWGWYFVTAHAKELLEASGLRHVQFRPTAFVPHLTEYDSSLEMEIDIVAVPGPNWVREPGEPVKYWEIDSDLDLPAVAPSMTTTDSAGKPVRDDFSQGIHRREGFYIDPELRYRASDLARLEPFDLARGREPFGMKREYRLACPLIASRRFREICVSQGLRAGWRPVHIAPD